MDRTLAVRVAVVAVIGAVAWMFWDSPAVWPLKILVVLFHELGHAAAALLTGGEVVSIGLSPDQGGVTHTIGGWRFGVLNAGYLGSLASGVLWLFLARRPRSASIGAGLLAIILATAGVLWVRPVVGFALPFVMVCAAAAAWLALSGPLASRQWFLRALGVFSVLYALWDIRTDVFGGTGVTDASMLAELTFIPAPVWGAVWIVAGLATLFALRRWLV